MTDQGSGIGRDVYQRGRPEFEAGLPRVTRMAESGTFT